MANGSAVAVGPSSGATIETSELIGQTTGAITMAASAWAQVTNSILHGVVTGDPTASVTIANTELMGTISGPGATCFAVSTGWNNVNGLTACP